MLNYNHVYLDLLQSDVYWVECYYSSQSLIGLLMSCRCALRQLQRLLRRVPEVSCSQRGWPSSTTEEPAVQQEDIQRRQRLDHCNTLLIAAFTLSFETWKFHTVSASDI